MVITPEIVLSIGAGLALAAAAGFRVFVPLLALSIAARSGWTNLAPGFEWIGTTPALMAFATATVAEVAAYFVPFFDNLLDAIATPAAVVAGVVASAAVLGDLPPWLRYSVALVGAGGTAGVVQTGTALLRLKSSATTAGFGNPVLAVFELIGSLMLTLISLVAPFLALIFVIALLTISLRAIARRINRRRQITQT